MDTLRPVLIAVYLDEAGAQRRAAVSLRSGAWRTQGQGAPAAAVVSSAARAHQLRRQYPNCQVIFVALNGSEQNAVAALRAGCCDYLRQEEIEQQLGAVVERALSGD